MQLFSRLRLSGSAIVPLLLAFFISSARATEMKKASSNGTIADPLSRKRLNNCISASWSFAGVNGKIAVRHLQDDQRHRGGVVVAGVAFPVAGVVLLGDELIADGGIPLGPVIAAGQEHRLDGVIVAV